MSVMNVGFDAKRLYNNFTGLGNHSRTTIDILTEFFPENAYFLYTPKIARGREESLKRYLSMEACRTIMPQGVLKGSLWRTYGLPADIRRDGVDLFHGLSNELPVGIRRSGVPSVVTIHDVAFHTFPDMYHWIDRQMYDWKWAYAVRNADRVIAISECTKRDIMRYYDVDADKIDVVYQPVQPRYYTPMAKEDATKRLEFSNLQLSSDFMLYVGSVNSRKNLLGVVKAMEMLPHDLLIPLVVIGSGRGYMKEVRQYVAEHGLERYVIFPDGKVDDDTLQALYACARVFVYPSFYEGFGLPVVEALLSRCPVVTSNVSSLPEAGGAYSQQAAPADVGDIASKIEKVLADDALSSTMREKGYEYAVRTFHPHVLAERLMSVYKAALDI